MGAPEEKDIERSPSGEASREEEKHSAGASTSSPKATDRWDPEYEVDWDGLDDPKDPRNIRYARKWLITFVIAFSSFCVTVNSTLYTTTYDQLIPRFNTSKEICTLGLTTFVLGLMVGPILLAPLSEFYGRLPVYVASYAGILIFLIPCAVAQNMATILVTRFIDGFFASCFLSVCGGTIGDMFDKTQLSWPMLGGFINQYTDWRWSFWVLAIWTGIELIVIWLLVPETYKPVLLRRKAQRLRKETGNEKWHAPIEKLDRSIPKTLLRSFIRPLQLLALEPMVLNLCLLSAVLLGILYLFFGAYPIVFEDGHGFTLSQVGLSFIGLAIGMLLGMVSDPLWQIWYRRLVRQAEAEGFEPGHNEPEFRLPPTVVGVWFFVGGMFGFGWTTYSFVHWIVPIIFSVFEGFGIVTSFYGIFTFLVESYPLYAASALGANAILRSVFAAGFPLFGDQMYNNIGYQWATTILAVISLLLAPFPYIFFRYGKKIRQKSKFAKIS